MRWSRRPHPPQFTWTEEGNGAFRVAAADKPKEVRLWQATNPGARDFGLSSIGAKWKGTPLAAQAAGGYVAKVPRPFRGFTAYMVEVTYPSGLPLVPLTFTTGVKVVPDIEPFKDLTGAGK